MEQTGDEFAHFLTATARHMDDQSMQGAADIDDDPLTRFRP